MGSYPHSALPLARARSAPTEQYTHQHYNPPTDCTEFTETTGGEYSPTDCTDFHRCSLRGCNCLCCTNKANDTRVWHPAIPSYFCENLCNLWEALICQKVLWVLRVPWKVLIRSYVGAAETAAPPGVIVSLSPLLLASLSLEQPAQW